MIKIAIIGAGNVATHLAKAFNKTKGVSLVQIYSRNNKQLESFTNFTETTNKLTLLKEADVYIIAVSDDAITDVSSKINKKNSLIVHTSGSVSIEAIKSKGRKGVFYLLQSFSKTKEVNFNDVPFCLETENRNDFLTLEKLAKSIGKKIYAINSEQRKSLHVAAVFVNNFSNHMYKIGSDICDKYNVPFEVLQPLIKETAEKIRELSPEKAQTGPAKRKDTATINNHLELLDTEQKKIYQLITKSIQKNGEKL